MASLRDLLREVFEPLLAKALSQFQPPTNPSQQPSEPPPTDSAPSSGIALKPKDQTRAADLRIALLLGKIPEDAGLLIDAHTLANLLSIAKSTLYRLQAEEAIPAPVQVGRLKKWRLTEILDWIEADCPPHSVWVHRRPNSAKGKRK
jgi:predicted DNA-binding transcriptional regulator AlpA